MSTIDELRGLVTWVSEPPSAFLGDARVLRFVLFPPTGDVSQPTYYGSLFYKRRSATVGHLVGSGAAIHTTGPVPQQLKQGDQRPWMVKISIPVGPHPETVFGATFCDFDQNTKGPGAELRRLEAGIAGGPSLFSISEAGTERQFQVAKSTLRN